MLPGVWLSHYNDALSCSRHEQKSQWAFHPGSKAVYKLPTRPCGPILKALLVLNIMDVPFIHIPALALIWPQGFYCISKQSIQMFNENKTCSWIWTLSHIELDIICLISEIQHICLCCDWMCWFDVVPVILSVLLLFCFGSCESLIAVADWQNQDREQFPSLSCDCYQTQFCHCIWVYFKAQQYILQYLTWNLTCSWGIFVSF